MPTYDYECTECNGRFEIYQSMSAPRKEKCESCGAPKGLKRLIGSGGGIIFKGSGFYETDYRKKEYSDQAEKERSHSSNGSSGSSDGEKSGKKKEVDKKKNNDTTSFTSSSDDKSSEAANTTDTPATATADA